MKAIASILLVMMLGIMLYAVEEPLEITLSGQSFFNVLRVSSFDTKAPGNQPVFFRIVVKNKENNDFNDAYLRFTLAHNGTELVNSRAKYKPTIAGKQTFVLTNRDIFVENETAIFGKPDPKISAIDIMDKIPDVKDVVLNTGLFPDGDYKFTLRFENRNNKIISNEVSLNIKVKNPSGIFLVRPGGPAGKTPPTVSDQPITFIWSSNLAGMKDSKFQFVLKEFDDSSMMTPGFIETGGRVIVNEKDLDVPFYSKYIPLKDGRFYAWQVSTKIIDPAAGRYSKSDEINSPFNVFQYVEHGQTDDSGNIAAVNDFLKGLGIPAIMQLLGDGYTPTGVIEYNGVFYSGNDAEALLRELLQKAIKKVVVSE